MDRTLGFLTQKKLIKHANLLVWLLIFDRVRYLF